MSTISKEGFERVCHAPQVCWVVEDDHTVVLNEQTMHTMKLQGVSAAIWDWITLGYPLGEVVEMISVFQGQSDQDAERRVRDALAAWTVAGFIVRDPGRTDGESGHQ